MGSEGALSRFSDRIPGLRGLRIVRPTAFLTLLKTRENDEARRQLEASPNI
jgi:hypothetical protein